MKYLNYKDNLYRKKFELFETERLRYKSLSRNYILPPSIRFFYKNRLSSLLKNSSMVKIRNRCKIVCRGQSVYRFFRLNRATLKSFVGSNFLFGIRKSSW